MEKHENEEGLPEQFVDANLDRSDPSSLESSVNEEGEILLTARVAAVLGILAVVFTALVSWNKLFALAPPLLGISAYLLGLSASSQIRENPDFFARTELHFIRIAKYLGLATFVFSALFGVSAVVYYLLSAPTQP